MITPTASLADRCITLGITLFLMYGILMLGWSAGQMLVGVWLQTLVLFVLVVVAALVIAAKTHWLVFLLAIPLVGFVAFVLSRFIDLFGMFAWGAWAEEQGLKIRILSFNPFRNLPHFAARVTEVLPLWQVSVIVALETLIILPLLATKPNDAGHFVRLFETFNRKIFVNHFALLIGTILASFLGGARAIMLTLLGLLLAIDLTALIRALHAKRAEAA
jgi:hypothetical protein